jgi:formylmethanofuran dehydrogenase subunit E
MFEDITVKGVDQTRHWHLDPLGLRSIACDNCCEKPEQLVSIRNTKDVDIMVCYPCAEKLAMELIRSTAR